MKEYKTYYFLSNINGSFITLAFEKEFPNEPYELIEFKEFKDKIPAHIEIPVVRANLNNPNSHIIKRPLCLACNIEESLVKELGMKFYNKEFDYVNEAIAKMEEQARENYEDSTLDLFPPKIIH